MTRQTSPTVRRRRFARAMRDLRIQAGLSAEEVRKELDWSSGQLNKIETAVRRQVDPVTVRALLDLYKVDDPAIREGLIKLSREMREKGWWAKYDASIVDDYIGFEAEASIISTYQAALIPGLLQTPEYAAEVARTGLAATEEQVHKVVRAREERQEQVFANHPEVFAVIDEAALQRLRRHPEVAEEQFQSLIDSSRAFNRITIQVLPLSAGMHASPTGSFVVLDYVNPIDPTIIYIEGRTAGTFLEDDHEVTDYRRIFGALQRSAMSEAETISFVSHLLTEVSP